MAALRAVWPESWPSCPGRTIVARTQSTDHSQVEWKNAYGRVPTGRPNALGNCIGKILENYRTKYMSNNNKHNFIQELLTLIRAILQPKIKHYII